MNSVNDIWNSIMGLLSSELTSTSINTWFSDCKPIEISDTRLVIYTPTEFKRNIITQRFSGAITSALTELFSCPFDLLVLAEDELDDYEQNCESDDSLPEVAGYTFDKFIVGNSNKFAHAAAVAVADNPGVAYNPLFIYGNSGLGKTHLLLSIGQRIHETDTQASIAYVKGDDFINQMVQSIKDNTQEEFRNKYRYVDLLLVDDIQFIAGKIGVQEEFFHTFNNLYEAGKQIVITSDRPPMEMVKLEDRLRTRFEGGLMADIQPPDMETRMAIIRNKAAQLGMVLPDDVVEYIADTIKSNIRQIEGVVKRLTAYNSILNDEMNISSAKRAIKDVIRVGEFVPTPDIIIEETARYYSLEPVDLRGQRRSKNTAMARQISMYLMRSLTNLSLKDIGEQYEDRNHSTVLSSIRKVEELIIKDASIGSTIRDITSNINTSHGQ
ncbi:MAG: chromosomal replication initiator protein DnaA [Oscillospiraceae bacterium]|nr:chromosomal replication initiator protein DnaA [Oscillospiraceae bacterium]